MVEAMGWAMNDHLSAFDDAQLTWTVHMEGLPDPGWLKVQADGYVEAVLALDVWCIEHDVERHSAIFDGGVGHLAISDPPVDSLREAAERMLHEFDIKFPKGQGERLPGVKFWQAAEALRSIMGDMDTT